MCARKFKLPKMKPFKKTSWYRRTKTGRTMLVHRRLRP